MIFYYSGCGNSRWAAQELAAALHEELRFIPDLQREGFNSYTPREGESLGFVFPIYAWAAPKLVEDFVQQVRWEGKPAYTYYLCTCGDETGKTRQSFGRVLESVGLQLDACYYLQMPETYLFFPGFHLDTPEGEQRKIKAAREKLTGIIEHIKQQQAVVDELPGSLAWLKSGLIRKGFVNHMTDKKFHVTDACNGCGTCVDVCPLQNIQLTDMKPQWQGHCTQCAACYNHCPQNAIHFANYTVGKGQYYFK